MELGTKWCSNVLITNLAIVFANSLPKMPFAVNLAPELRTSLSLSSRKGLISNSAIVILNSVPKLSFWGKFGP